MCILKFRASILFSAFIFSILSIPILGLDNLEFVKYEHNPALDVGPSGSWDSVQVSYPMILKAEAGYKMWYGGAKDGKNRIGYATSQDGIDWVKYPQNPILSYSGSGWEKYSIGAPYVVFKEGIYHMWYSGYDGYIAANIGYANSTDGIAWTKYSGNPILKIGTTGEWDSRYLNNPSVLFEDGIYKMWYEAGYPYSPSSAEKQRIGYTTSKDGLDWKKYEGNPVFEEGNYVHAPSVIKIGDTYLMLYSYSSTVSGLMEIHMATSKDGLIWDIASNNPVLALGPLGSWDALGLDQPYVLYENGKIRVWYKGFGSDGKKRIGYAEASLSGLSPIADFEASVTEGGMPLKVQFTDLTQNSPNSWNWDFGDGETSSEQNPTHTYSFPGTYTVKLEASNSIGPSAAQKTEYIKVWPVSSSCPQGPELELLKRLNSYPYDFYEEYYNYNDNAVSHDPQKGCHTDIENDDIWMVRLFKGSPALYPSGAYLINSEIGIDFNEWYEKGQKVETYIYGYPDPLLKTDYPEYEVDVIRQLERIPIIGGDPYLLEKANKLLEANEFSISLDGVYAQGPISKASDSRAEISTRFGGYAKNPATKQSLDCQGSFIKYYDSDSEVFGTTLPDQIGCRASLGMEPSGYGYHRGLSLDLLLFSFEGEVLASFNITPNANAGVNAKLNSPQAIVPGGKAVYDIGADGSIIGDFYTHKSHTSINKSLPLPKLSGISLLGESAFSIGDFPGHQGVRSLFTRISDGKEIEYRGLKQFSPVFRMESSEIALEADIKVDLRDFKIPCGNTIGCEQEIYSGEIFSIPPWEFYLGQTKIIARSPVDITAYSPKGEAAGKNSLEIYGSKYLEEGHEKTIIFPTDTESFFVEVRGTGSGNYTLEVSRPIKIEGNEGNLILQNVVFLKEAIPTREGKADIFTFSFRQIESRTNELVKEGMNIEEAIELSLSEYSSFEDRPQKSPSIVGLSWALGYIGKTAELSASLFSREIPLEGEEILFYIGGEFAGSAKTDGNGIAALSATVPESLAPKIHLLEAYYEGSEDFLPSSAASDFAALCPAPEISITAPKFAGNSALIEGNVIGAEGGTLILLIDDEFASGSLPYLWENIEEGLHKIEVEAYSPCNKKAKKIAYIFSDLSPPEILFENIGEGGFYQPLVPKIRVEDAWLDEYLIYLNGLPHKEEEIIETEGLHEIEVQAQDMSGKSSISKISFTIDNTPPVIEAFGVKDGETYFGQAKFYYTIADELSPIREFFSTYPNNTIFDEVGEYSIDISAFDLAGNFAQKSVSFSIEPGCKDDFDCPKGDFCMENGLCEKAFKLISIQSPLSQYLTKMNILVMTRIARLSDADYKSHSLRINGEEGDFEVFPKACVPEKLLDKSQGRLCIFHFSLPYEGGYSIDALVNSKILEEGALSISAISLKSRIFK